MSILIISCEIVVLVVYLNPNHVYTKSCCSNKAKSSLSEEQFLYKKMASKIFPCLICVFLLLVLFSFDCDAFGNGAGSSVPAKTGKKTLQRNTLRVSVIISETKTKQKEKKSADKRGTDVITHYMRRDFC